MTQGHVPAGTTLVAPRLLISWQPTQHCSFLMAFKWGLLLPQLLYSRLGSAGTLSPSGLVTNRSWLFSKGRERLEWRGHSSGGGQQLQEAGSEWAGHTQPAANS